MISFSTTKTAHAENSDQADHKEKLAMKQRIGLTFSIVLTLLLLTVLYSGAAVGQASGKLDGKALFLAQKCNVCHSVPTAGIERTVKSEKVMGPDLVNIKTDAGVLIKFL